MNEHEVSLNELYLMMGRLEGKMDTVLSRTSSQEHRIGNCEERIGKLEKSKMWLVGLAAGFGAAAGHLPRMFGGQ